MVQAVFYDRAGQWDASAADRTSILDSFHIAQSATFEPEPGGIAGGGVFHAGRRALIGGIVGGLIGLVVTMFKRKAQQRGN